MGETIDLIRMVNGHAFCIVKHMVLEDMCPFRAGLLHDHDRNPNSYSGAEHKVRKVLEIFIQI